MQRTQSAFLEVVVLEQQPSQLLQLTGSDGVHEWSDVRDIVAAEPELLQRGQRAQADHEPTAVAAAWPPTAAPRTKRQRIADAAEPSRAPPIVTTVAPPAGPDHGTSSLTDTDASS